MVEKKSFLQRLFGPSTPATNPREFVHLMPIGSTGSENYAGYPAEEYLSTLRNRQRSMIYDQIRRSDHQARMCLSAVKAPILSASWEIQPGDDSDQAKADRDLIEQILFHDMGVSWKAKLREILTMLEFGFSVFEITHKIVANHPTFGTYNSLQSLGFRSQKTIERWNLDPSTGELSSVSQYAYGDLGRLVDIPADYLLVFTNEMEGSNYEGVSILRACYGSWLRKDRYLKLNAIGIEKFAVPTPIVEVPEQALNNEQYQNMVQVLAAYAQNQTNFITYPVGWKLDLRSNAYDPSKVEQSIDSEDRRMSKAFLTNFLELGMGGSGGAYALSNDLSDFMQGALVHVAAIIEDVINQTLIPALVKMNRGERASYPKLRASGIDERAGKDLALALKTLADSAIIIPDDDLEEQMRKRFKLTPASKEGQRLNKAASPPAGAVGIPNQPDVGQNDQASFTEDRLSVKLSGLTLSERIHLAGAIRRSKKLIKDGGV